MIPKEFEKLLETEWEVEDKHISLGALRQSLDCRGSYHLGLDEESRINRVSRDLIAPVEFTIYPQGKRCFEETVKCVVQVLCVDKTTAGQYGRSVSGFGKVLGLYVDFHYPPVYYEPQKDIVGPVIFGFGLAMSMGMGGSGKFHLAGDFWAIWKSFHMEIAGEGFIKRELEIHPQIEKLR